MDSDAPESDDDTLAILSALLADVPPELESAADAAVREADGVEALVTDLEELLAGHDHGDDADAGDPVGCADSLSELRDALGERDSAAGGRDPTTDDARDDGPTAAEVTLDGDRAVETANRARERASEAGRDAVTRLRSGLDGLRDRVGDEEASAGAADGDGGEVELPPAGTETPPNDPVSAPDSDGEDPSSVGDDGSASAAGTGGRRLPVPEAGDTRRTLARARTRAGAGVADLKYTLQNADPKRAAIWGLATGATLANPAIAAGYSTAVLLSGAVLGGTAVGAYATSHEGTVLDELDPLEMARSANGVAAANRNRSKVNGAAMGSVLGATSYVAGQITPEGYAHWLADVDLDTVARGAELGVGAAHERDDLDLDSGTAGALLGGGLGAAYGLATEGGEDDGALQELLDADLYEDYRRSLDAGDGDEGGDA